MSVIDSVLQNTRSVFEQCPVTAGLADTVVLVPEGSCCDLRAVLTSYRGCTLHICWSCSNKGQCALCPMWSPSPRCLPFSETLRVHFPLLGCPVLLTTALFPWVLCEKVLHSSPIWITTPLHGLGQSIQCAEDNRHMRNITKCVISKYKKVFHFAHSQASVWQLLISEVHSCPCNIWAAVAKHPHVCKCVSCVSMDYTCCCCNRRSANSIWSWPWSRFSSSQFCFRWLCSRTSCALSRLSVSMSSFSCVCSPRTRLCSMLEVEPHRVNMCTHTYILYRDPQQLLVGVHRKKKNHMQIL